MSDTRNAREVNDLAPVAGILTAASDALRERNIRAWGQLWREAWERDVAWLKLSLKSLKKIKIAAAHITAAEDHSDSAVARDRIIRLATDATVQQMGSGINVDDL